MFKPCQGFHFNFLHLKMDTWWTQNVAFPKGDADECSVILYTPADASPLDFSWSQAQCSYHWSTGALSGSPQQGLLLKHGWRNRSPCMMVERALIQEMVDHLLPFGNAQLSCLRSAIEQKPAATPIHHTNGNDMKQQKIMGCATVNGRCRFGILLLQF